MPSLDLSAAVDAPERKKSLKKSLSKLKVRRRWRCMALAPRRSAPDNSARGSQRTAARALRSNCLPTFPH